MVHGRFSQNRRTYGKEQTGNVQRGPGNRRLNVGVLSSPSHNAERESYETTVLENALDSYNPRSLMGSGMETSGNSGRSTK
jgi:hypothetical protein